MTHLEIIKICILSKIHDDGTCLEPFGFKSFFLKFYLHSSILINDPQGMASLDFRDMVGRIYVHVGDH